MTNQRINNKKNKGKNKKNKGKNGGNIYYSEMNDSSASNNNNNIFLFRSSREFNHMYNSTLANAVAPCKIIGALSPEFCNLYTKSQSLIGKSDYSESFYSDIIHKECLKISEPLEIGQRISSNGFVHTYNNYFGTLNRTYPIMELKYNALDVYEEKELNYPSSFKTMIQYYDKYNFKSEVLLAKTNCNFTCLNPQVDFCTLLKRTRKFISLGDLKETIKIPLKDDFLQEVDNYVLYLAISTTNGVLSIGEPFRLIST
ncbi:hypothetical protein H8356DRAFT_1653012 [Neocallimastix lanati (nom. inval.)]|uniref:Uncharacterized protein n=1 Tax=Neocallimastix californiae TaxID=1754190 RepID=A0A1Y2F317_9FUNG|nr:hypothetical protein H8356DRAFT_1653012 [Neocallimastix sp. JGI-2020a]ORY77874.1 hypothetical protein LY90DRAFT_501191 [Neocallimastix californiae]|eukprot:ORY77874.1 hypothetical protein LY90DRAFT_501191 [Neocallimastix californiae]